MAYGLETITEIADCDYLTAEAIKVKKTLEYKKTGLERQQENFTENTVEVSSDLVTKQAELDAVNSVIPTLPEGQTKDENVKRQKKLEYEIFLLNDRKGNYGNVALVDKSYDLEITTQ